MLADVLCLVSPISRGALILADTIVIGVTWAKTFSQLRLAHQVGLVSITQVLMRDGKQSTDLEVLC